METYTTGTGQNLLVHDRNEDCDKNGCVIHNPSDHCMSEFSTNWRYDRGIMERICPHGIGHPDPDGIKYIHRTRGEESASYEEVHGCDGCCMLDMK